MIDPGTIAAKAIVELAYEGLVKAGAAEAGKQAVQGTVELTKSLWQRIKAQFKGNQRAESAIADLKASGSEAALAKLEKYVDLELDEDPVFASEVRQIAHQIINSSNQNIVNNPLLKINQGRDQMIINGPSDDRDYLTGLSIEELKALADCKLAIVEQSRLDDLLKKNNDTSITEDELIELDKLLAKADHLTVVKTRARYTLQKNEQGLTVA